MKAIGTMKALRHLKLMSLRRRAKSLLLRLIHHSYSEIEQFEGLRVAIAQANFEFEKGLQVLNGLLKEMKGRDFDFRTDSVHWLLFACLSVKETRLERILEIGTFDAEFTALLARLFPRSEILTIDLPDNDPLMRSTYGRENEADYLLFKNKRDFNLQAENIYFLQINTAFMLERVQGKFDAIWVDGGHLFPEIAWDLATAHYLCKRDGFLFCDDVIPAEKGIKTKYVSPESYQTLLYLSERTSQPVQLFLKRCSFQSSAQPKRKKFVALLKIRPPTELAK